MSYNYDKPFDIKWGVSHRFIYDHGNFDQSLSILPDGNSGQPGSPHYGDQTELFINGEFNDDYVSRERAEKDANYKAVFKP
jgi:penicillin G amidase